MKAQSNVYIQLQNIYKSKARQDASEVVNIAQGLAADVVIDPAEVEQFCKNARFIRLINSTQTSPKMEDVVGMYSAVHTAFNKLILLQQTSSARTRLQPLLVLKCNRP